MRPLERDELLLVRDEPDERHLGEAAELLPADERERLHRFRSTSAAREYACGHLLLRRTLSALAPVEPDQWRFVVGPHGRPDLDPDQPGLPETCRGLSVNLSHTRGLCLVGLSYGGDCGVDVEHRQRANDLHRLADYKFARAERQWLAEAGSEEEFRWRFFVVWTLKESYLKARGTGISVPLDRFAAGLDEAGLPRIAFEPDFDPTPERWSFGLVDLGTRHAGAWALRGDRPPARVRIADGAAQG